MLQGVRSTQRAQVAPQGISAMSGCTAARRRAAANATSNAGSRMRRISGAIRSFLLARVMRGRRGHLTPRLSAILAAPADRCQQRTKRRSSSRYLLYSIRWLPCVCGCVPMRRRERRSSCDEC